MPVVLVNLLKYNLTNMERYPELPSVLTSSKGHEYAKCQTQRGTITAFTCFVQHHQR